jgi:hypothetical protein
MHRHSIFSEQTIFPCFKQNVVIVVMLIMYDLKLNLKQKIQNRKQNNTSSPSNYSKMYFTNFHVHRTHGDGDEKTNVIEIQFQEFDKYS